MVAVVNGYVCFSTCDAKSAQQGKDPHASPGALPGEDSKPKNGLDSRPATVLDGALKDAAKALDPASGTSSGPPSRSVDVLA